MTALLAGAKLAAHTLQLTSGSQELLPRIFPGVEHINYFRLRTDRATELLVDTGHHLGAVAVPYALAVHEDFVTSVVDLLKELGYTRKAPGRNKDLSKNPVKAWNMHDTVYLTLGGTVPTSGGDATAIEVFHLLREMRNAHIHAGGEVSDALKEVVEAFSADAAQEWSRLSRRRHGDLVSSKELRFNTFDIFAAFAVTKTLGRQINALLRDRMDHAHWAEIAVRDYAMQTSKARGSDSWMRGYLGYAAMNYGGIELTEAELVAAAVTTGFWTGGRQWASRRSERGAQRKRNQGVGKPGD